MFAEAALFDAGGVLLLPGGSAIASVLSPFHPDANEDQCRDAWSMALAECDQEQGRIDLARVRADWVRYAGVPKDNRREAVAALNAELARPQVGRHEVVSGAWDVLAGLKRRGVRLGCVSNSDGTVAAELERFGLAEYFDVIVDSHLVGIEKPDPRIFSLCLERMDPLTADQCVYVGDTHSHDVVPASRLGMRACHFDRLDLYRIAPPSGLRIGALNQILTLWD